MTLMKSFTARENELQAACSKYQFLFSKEYIFLLMQLGCENKKKKNIKNRNCCAVLLRQKSEVHVWGKTASECWTANIRNTSTCANSLSAPKFNFPELNEKPDFLAAERHVTLTKLTLSSSGANRKIQERVEEEFREEGKCKIQDLCENAVSYKTGSCRVQGRRGKEWDASRLEQETGGKKNKLIWHGV